MIARQVVLAAFGLAALPNIASANSLSSAPAGQRWSWKCTVKDDLGARIEISGLVRKVPKGDLTAGFNLDQVSTDDRKLRWLGWFSKDDHSMPHYLNTVTLKRSFSQLSFENSWGYMPQEVNVNRNVVLFFDSRSGRGRGSFRLIRDKRIQDTNARDHRGISASGPCTFKDVA